MAKLESRLIVGGGFLAMSLIAIATFLRVAHGGPAMAGPVKEAKSKPGSFAVVELYTSEGCSSCPPAEANLRRITEEAKSNGTTVYALDFHIDYWDRLGWIDVASNAAATSRQNDYANQFGNRSVYTPQMIINGKVEFNGSDGPKSDLELSSALAETTTFKIAVNAKRQDTIVIANWTASNPLEDDVILVALVQDDLITLVNAGENQGRTLHHFNVVRDFQTADASLSQGEVTLKLPMQDRNAPHHIVGFLQSRTTGQIRAATSTTF